MKYRQILLSLIFLCIGIFVSMKIHTSLIEIKRIVASPGYLTLSEKEVFDMLNDIKITRNTPYISYLSEFKEGDILIRRQINANTLLPNLIFPTYFTHMMYIGRNKTLLEAQGEMRNRKDDILMIPINESDLVNSVQNKNTMFVLRPTFSTSTISRITDQLAQIAHDNTYVFGVRKPKPLMSNYDQTLLCTSYITDVLEKELDYPSYPYITTPDYLFVELLKSDDFILIPVSTLSY